MPLRNDSDVVSFDADAAVRALRETVEGTLYSCCEYDTDEYNPLFVADETLSMYRDESHMREHFDQIHNHVHMDFMEVNLMVDSLFPPADRVRYIATAMDVLTLVRVYRDRDGLFLAVGTDEPVVPLVQAVEQVCEGSPAPRS